MRAYTKETNLSVRGVVVLTLGSLSLAVIAGTLAYLLSQFVYVPLLSPLAVGVATGFAYIRLQSISRVQHIVFTAALGMTVGLLLAASFTAAPYAIERVQLVKNAEQDGVDAQAASRQLDEYLLDETGSSGFLGYMKLRAMQGESYSLYFGLNGAVTRAGEYTVRSSGAWISWVLEALALALPVALISIFDRSHARFSASAQGFYGVLSNVGSLPAECDTELHNLLGSGDVRGIAELIRPDGELTHPMIDVSERPIQNASGYTLLVFRRTRRVGSGEVKRDLIGEWELEPTEAADFSDAMSE